MLDMALNTKEESIKFSSKIKNKGDEECNQQRTKKNNSGDIENFYKEFIKKISLS